VVRQEAAHLVVRGAGQYKRNAGQALPEPCLRIIFLGVAPGVELTCPLDGRVLPGAGAQIIVGRELARCQIEWRQRRIGGRGGISRGSGKRHVRRVGQRLAVWSRRILELGEMNIRRVCVEIANGVGRRAKTIESQVLAGTRQTGKTTLARQLMTELDMPSHYSAADEPALKGPAWIEQQWETARVYAGKKAGLLILDEIHKIAGWSETVKRLWDEDSAEDRHLQVILLGSAPLMIQDGLTESLAGRFEIIPVTHWSCTEMRDAFGWKFEEYIYYGGYPGSAE